MSQKTSTKKKSPAIKRNVDLTAFNTLRIPAIASSLVEITSAEQLKNLHRTAFFSEEKPFILGGGSNILLKGNISRPVIKISIEGIKITGQDDRHIWIEAGAGENWHRLVKWAVEQNFGGIENLALIPGTVGAAPIQNIGAYGVELKDLFESVTFFEISSGETKKFNAVQCRFEYRDSIFKNELKGDVIITSLALKLTKPPHIINDSYSSLRNYLDEAKILNPSIKDIYDAVVTIRKSKLPDPELIGNAGSFFKNPVVDTSVFQSLKEKYPEVPHYIISDDEVKIPAGWLIEKTGWKGKQIGNVGTYSNQALVIVNHGGASGAEVLSHAMKIRSSVAEIFGIELMPEVNIIE